MDKQKVIKGTKNLLKNMGVKPSYLGYKYWATAVYYAFEKDEEDIKMEELYLYIAKSHKTTRNRTERAMRYILEELNINKYFNTNYKLTNSTFLILLTEEAEKLLNNDVVYETRDFVERGK